MSTRGCIAIGTPKAWRGLYNHWDSYPTGLGAALWEHLQNKNLKDFANKLLKFDDWECYVRDGICEWCGKHSTQPRCISGELISMKYNGLLKPYEYPDPECKKHMHESYDDISESYITHKNADSLFIEWVYVIDPQRQEFHILFGNFHRGCHELINTYKLDSKEPDWKSIKKF